MKNEVFLCFKRRVVTLGKAFSKEMQDKTSITFDFLLLLTLIKINILWFVWCQRNVVPELW